MDHFDDVSLNDFPEDDLAGLVDMVAGRITPVRGARVVTSSVSGTYRLSVFDNTDKEFRYRDPVKDMETVHQLAAAFQARFDQAAGRVVSSNLVTVLTTPYRSSVGVAWSVTVRRRLLSSSHDYWMYFIQCEVDGTPSTGFMVMVKKHRVATLEQAEHIVTTEALDSAFGIIDRLAPGERRPLTITPSAGDEWVMI